jgi:ABC-type Na+ efflux pump permease subunit
MKPVLAIDIGQVIKPDGFNTLAKTYPDTGTLVSLIVKNGAVVAGIILLALLIVGGLMFIIGAGSDDLKKVQNAQSIIVSALIGFAVIFLAFIIIQIIQVITGLNILNSNL